MCGIAGIIELNKTAPIAELDMKLSSMLTQLIHRGPDGSGKKVFNYAGHWALLGHQRLSIIDLSHEADQPMLSRDGELCVVFNGEIYNYIELRQELAPHYPFRTISDTEVLLAAYNQWGEAMLDRLEGMFAFLIYNKSTGLFWGARDPFGIKPFYYSLSEDSFQFASEPVALWKTQSVKPKINQTTVADFLLFGLTDHTERTFFSDIVQLRGGHSISGKAGEPGSIKVKAWWKPEPVKLEENLGQHVYNCLEESIRIHLRSDVPVGGCLSGGLDSGSISHFAARLMKSNEFQFHSITFTEPGFVDDESELAQATAARTGTTIHFVSASSQELEQELEELTLAMGEPYSSLSMYAQFKVFKKAKALGLKVMLDGQGGDEVFAGYPRVAALVFKDYVSRLHLFNAWKELCGFRANASIGVKGLLGLNYFFTNPAFMERRAFSRFKGLVAEDLLRQFDGKVASEYFGPKSFEQAQFMELTKYIIPRLLRYEDRNSMRFSIESRVPLLSRSVVNLGLSLPIDARVKQGWTKYALRKAMEPYLPKKIIWQRKKRGFDVPQDQWTLELKPSLQNLLRESAHLNLALYLPRLTWNMQQGGLESGHTWRLISLQLWLLKNGLSI